MTLYLVRHGSAGKRNGSDPHDGQRHLDDKGRRQAIAVSDHLEDRPIAVVLSSPLPRCMETVAPLAESLGLEVQVDERLREGSDVSAVWDLVEQVAAQGAVLCSHGDVIPDVVRTCESRGMLLPDRPGFAKGSVWALNGWDGNRFSKSSWDKLR